MKTSNIKSLGIYIHIPFCERKCNYCDFYSLTNKEEYEEKYIDALLQEMDSYTSEINDCRVDTIFIGGGTPSFLNEANIGKILDKIKCVFNVDSKSEITMEANPNSLSFENVVKYKSYGINRISIGVQSLDENVLKFIGRIHDKKQAIEAIELVKKAGIDNINVDVMFNIPDQSKESVINTLRELVSLNVAHISFYSLKLEENTPLYSMEKKGLFTMIEDEEEREIYYAGRDFLEENGYFQYEISNFSKKNKECKHNLKYWTCGEYIGFGPFAHSYYNNIRYGNISDIKLYCDNKDDPKRYRVVDEILSEKDKMFEFLMLGLRMNKGIEISTFEEKFGLIFDKLYGDRVDKLIDMKLINREQGRLFLTNKGMDISNYVFEELLM